MTFDLANVTPLVIVFLAVAALAVAVAVGALATLFARSHTTRARREGAVRYHGRLVLGG